jgi:hypothetical protein
MSSLYEKDFYGWTGVQATLLRNKEFDQMDLENLIDEVECLGRSEKRALKSHLKILLTHMLKKKYQPEKYTKSWDLSIKNARCEFMQCLNENPSLRPKLHEIFEQAYLASVVAAIKETGLENVFPEKCPWTLEEILE